LTCQKQTGALPQCSILAIIDSIEESFLIIIGTEISKRLFCSSRKTSISCYKQAVLSMSREYETLDKFHILVSQIKVLFTGFSIVL
jgi:hypothetical protein